MDFREIIEFLKDFLIYFIIVIVVFLVFLFIFSFQRIAGNSMEPTYSNNDIAILSKIHKTLFGIKKNDIIAFSTSSGETFIKRVIAIPGDTIYAKDNKVYVNNEELQEDYIKEAIIENFKFDKVCNVEGCDENKIPENYYFVLGDNRKDSIDSRFNIIGLINKKNIIGKVLFKIFPWG